MMDLVPNIEPELLVATFSATGDAVFCNAAWRQLLGPTQSPWQGLSDDDKERAHQALREAATGSLVTNHVVQASTRKRDEPLPVLLQFLPVHETVEDAQVICAITIMGEVMAEPASWTVSQTKQHRMEALGRMTMGIAHDFNNLLSGLVGHVELLKNEAREIDLPSSVHHSLRTIEQVAEDGGALIHKLQRYIRQETAVHFETVDLAVLLEDCIALTQPYWYNEPRRQGITIALEKAFDDVPAIMGSPTELREVFVNLILNAVQAMPKGGTLHFEVGVDDERRIAVSVADTGIGMSEDVRSRIFEPLFTTKGQDGTGMGLAVSFGIVQEHDGTIAVDTAPGEGTTFTLTFPPAPQDSRPLPSSSQNTRDVSSAAVLVVDDESMVRSVITKLLTLRGHTVHQASSGAEALTMIETAEPDIMFTDYGMPEMNGAELAAAVRNRQPSLPIVLISGDTETDDATPVVDASIDKPFKLDDLQAAIQALVNS